MKKTQNIAIVGGGAAGLAAAYTILKQGNVHVDLFEAHSTLGGRMHSRRVRGHSIDFGGFLIYPWYKETHKIFQELDIERSLIKTPECDIFYYLNGYTSGFRAKDIPFSKRDTLEFWAKSLFKILPKTELAHPDLNRFNRQTISEYVRTTLDKTTHAGLYETFLDTVYQGYCYGPVNQAKTALMAPMMREITLHGDVRKTSLFAHGTGVFVDAITQKIQGLDGTIHLNSPVTNVEGLCLTAAKKKKSYDAVLFAQTVSPNLYSQILPQARIECWYTHFVTVAVELSDTPTIEGTQNWGGIFYESLPDAPHQVLTVINLESLYGKKLHGCLTINIILGSAYNDSLSKKEIEIMARAEVQRLYPQVDLKKIADFVHWKKTMPVAQESFVETIRRAHGHNGYYFAGDFLGAPSIETAVSSGVRAAKGLLEGIS